MNREAAERPSNRCFPEALRRKAPYGRALPPCDGVRFIVPVLNEVIQPSIDHGRVRTAMPEGAQVKALRSPVVLLAEKNFDPEILLLAAPLGLRFEALHAALGPNKGKAAVVIRRVLTLAVTDKACYPQAPSAPFHYPPRRSPPERRTGYARDQPRREVKGIRPVEEELKKKYDPAVWILLSCPEQFSFWLGERRFPTVIVGLL